MLDILVCDNEKPSLERLADKIVGYLKVREIALQITTLMNGGGLVEDCENGRFDIAFLDISMDRLNGIEAAGLLREMNPEICIVFVAGHIDYVLGGYEAGAFRYLMKDSLDRSFEECMGAVLKKFHIDTDGVCPGFTNEAQYLRVDEVCLVESQGRKLLFLAANDQRVIGIMDWKLSEMESLLGRCGFLKVHQSHMMNIRYTVNIVSYYLEMQQKTTLHIPKNRYRYVKRGYAFCKGESL